MNELEVLATLAAKRLWACAYRFDERGEVTFDVTGLDDVLRIGCRMGARGENSYTMFYIAATLEEADGACDALLVHMRRNAAARGKRLRTLEDRLARWTRMCSSRRTREASKVA